MNRCPYHHVALVEHRCPRCQQDRMIVVTCELDKIDRINSTLGEQGYERHPHSFATLVYQLAGAGPQQDHTAALCELLLSRMRKGEVASELMEKTKRTESGEIEVAVVVCRGPHAEAFLGLVREWAHRERINSQ